MTLRPFLRTPGIHLLAAILAFAAVLTHHGRAAAQTCDPTEPGCGAGPPAVVITPGGTTWTGTAQTTSVPVQVQFCQSGTGIFGSGGEEITLDGALQTFSDGAVSNGCFTASGTVTFGYGTHVLAASLTTVGGTGSASVSYVYQPYTAPPTYQIDVTSDVSTATSVMSWLTTATFQVTNGGNVPATVSLLPVCMGSATYCTPTQNSVSLPAGGTTTVGVSYAAGGTLGSTGTVMLTAWNAAEPTARDSSSTAITSDTAPNRGRLGMRPDMLRLDRSECVILSAGAGAAFECGDLRLAHSMPAVRLRNRASAPTLVYNSQHASGYTVVPAFVSPLAGATTPDTIRAVLTVNGVNYSGKWRGWPADTLKRIAVGFDAAQAGLPTGIYGYTLTITGTYNSGAPAQAIATLQNELVVVNRRASAFGAGWWLAGLEQLVPAGARWLWVGGDGSYHVYSPVAGSTTAWVTEAYDRPDTLLKVDTLFVRRLPGRVEVHFDGFGRHVETVNAKLERTRFWWNGTYLDHVDLPVAGYAYSFAYGNEGSTRLSSVSSPGPASARVTAVQTANDGTGRVTRITDPDGTYVGFSYAGTDWRVEKRTTRRGFTTRYGWGEGSKLTLLKHPVAVGDTLSTTFRAAEGQGVTTASVWTNVYSTTNGPRTDVTDVTTFMQTRNGPVFYLAEQQGRNTYINRGDARFPGLVTLVQYPNNRIVTAAYDDRGHLIASVDQSTTSSDGRRASTTYEWDRACDMPTRVVQPEGESVNTAYTSFCTPDWTQPGADSARRVRFSYRALTDASAPGQVASVTYPALPGQSAAPTERYEYDVRGNLSAVVSPLGIRGESYADAIGRDTLTRTSIDDTRWQLQRHVYDVMGRDTLSESIGPAMGNHPQLTLRVRTHYTLDGQADTVARTSIPDTAHVGWIRTRWSYDAAGRKTSETSSDGYAETYKLDGAGNDTAVITRRGRHIAMTYDVMNRLTRRITDTTQYAPNTFQVGMITTSAYIGTWTYPHYANAAGGALLIPADTATFTYDPLLGAMTGADNHDAHIRRTYNVNGSLASDSIAIRTWAELSAGGNLTQHGYMLRYTYDLDGRRTQLQHPSNIAPHNATTGVTYDLEQDAYDPVTGGLSQVTSVLGLQYRFFYNLQGQLDSTAYPGGTGEKVRYDLDGRLTERVLQGPNYNSSSVPIHHPTYDYTGENRGKPVFVEDGGLVGEGLLTLTYNGLGALAIEEGEAGPNTAGFTNEIYIYDALGHRVSQKENSQTSDPTLSDFDPGTDRVIRTHMPIGQAYPNGSTPPADYSAYDQAGNLTWYQLDNHGRKMFSVTRNYYGADEKLRVSERWSCYVTDVQYYSYSNISAQCQVPSALDNSNAGAYEEYRYDALGRRIAVRTRREPFCTSQSCASTLTRTVWDGDQILYEMRAKGGDSESAATLENDGETGSYWGRVAYTHGGGIDQPLDLIRMGYTLPDSTGYGFNDWGGPYPILPFANWRGNIDAATTARGQKMPCQNLCTVNIHLPGDEYQAYFSPRDLISRQSWFGSLIENKLDGTGQMYMRNRYYNPGTGTFTQSDPAGIAGGLNTYGFAEGDPVNYSDPYGLCPPQDANMSIFCDGWGWGYFKNDVLGLRSVPMQGSHQPGQVYLSATVNGGIASVTGQVGGMSPGIRAEDNLPPNAPGAFVTAGVDYDTARKGEVPVDVSAGPVSATVAVSRKGKGLSGRVINANVSAGAEAPVPHLPVTGHPQPPEHADEHSLIWCAKVGCE